MSANSYLGIVSVDEQLTMAEVKKVSHALNTHKQ